MMRSVTKTRGKVFAAFAALAAAACMASGGIATAVYAEEEHTHSFSDTLTAGLRTHWYACECGTVKGLEEHNFENDTCTECGAEKPDLAHVHEFNETKWEYDTVNHWHQATCHGIVKDIAKHEADENGLCTCGYLDPTKIPAEVPENISVAGGYLESMYAEWKTKSVNDVTAYYQPVGGTEWTQVDQPLIRMVSSDTARVDVLGLEQGAYDLKISLGGSESIVKNINVTQYDRSGYAHFGYKDGLGAYYDNGTIKNNTLVIYLTEDNKNEILDSCYVNGEKVDISKYMRGEDGTQYSGIGEMLNNRRYSGNDRQNVGIAKLTHVYGAVAIRVIGKVEATQLSDGTASIVGLTDYDSTGNGGSVGDNGRMARMVNAKNLTIEGVGENASIEGWGIHFISSTIARDGADDGKSFEVRNIVFNKYPEDAVGMEGEQTNKNTSSTLAASVERCWIHNNTFLEGYCAKPAESDKAEGDGSCDFKRGEYFTCSYNYFENCHKTNLVGSADYSLQFNLTFHHNYWYNCKARQPLIRNSNVHFYNNYLRFTTDYSMSLRANCYAFAEANYFDSGNRFAVKSGGVAKSYGNVIVGMYGEDQSDHVISRTDAVSNNCKFQAKNIDYSHFDTDPNLFYYDAVNEKSDCYLTDAVTARQECILYSGAQKRDYTKIDTSASKYTPAKAVSLTDTMTEITLPSSKGDTEVNGVMFRDMSGATKAKGQYVTFKLAYRAEI